MTHAAHSHAALELREQPDVFDTMTRVADLAMEASKQTKALAAENSELRLVLAMCDEVLRKGTWHHSYRPQVAGVRAQIRSVFK